MILSTHAFLASQIASFDADAVAFFARVTAAGGTLSATEKIATNQLVLDLKANSLWTPMKAIYPMVGASAAACAQNLVSSSFTGTFTSGWTFTSTGATPNGTSAYFNTTLVPSTSLALDSTHISAYSRTNSAVNAYDFNAGNNLEIVMAYMGIFYYCVNSGEISAGAQSTSTGFFNVSRTASNLQKAYYNNSVKNSSSGASTTLPLLSLIYGALNAVTKGYWSNRQTAFLSAGDGLTDTQASNFYTAVQAFQVSLSRSV
jgi:hypothetical protein